jgi:hypothetical protein
MPDFGVPQLQTVQQGQALQIILPNELPLITWSGMFSRRMQELPILGWLIRADMSNRSAINTLPKFALFFTGLMLIGLILLYFRRHNEPNLARSAATLLGMMSVPWLLLGLLTLYERPFTTCLELHPNEFRIIEQRPWGQLLLATGPLEGALEVELQRAYTERDSELGGKRRCNLYIHHAGRRMRIARGLQEELCLQAIHTTERYVQERKALPSTTP